MKNRTLGNKAKGERYKFRVVDCSNQSGIRCFERMHPFELTRPLEGNGITCFMKPLYFFNTLILIPFVFELQEAQDIASEETLSMCTGLCIVLG